MTNNAGPQAPDGVPAQSGAIDEGNATAPNPRRHFHSPELLMADPATSDTEKQALLCEWDLEIDNRLKAEEEGMSASDPMRSSREAQLADEAARVKNCLTEINARLAAC
jgi:hypothetical protein